MRWWCQHNRELAILKKDVIIPPANFGGSDHMKLKNFLLYGSIFLICFSCALILFTLFHHWWGDNLLTNISTMVLVVIIGLISHWGMEKFLDTDSNSAVDDDPDDDDLR